jgi:hypothetical protein
MRMPPSMLPERALQGAGQAMAPFTDRTLDVAVTQSAGDRTCSNPRAVLCWITDPGDDADQALRDLQRAPAFDIDLSLSDNSPGNSKVSRQSLALSIPAMTSIFFGIPQELTGRVKLPFAERAPAPPPQPPAQHSSCACALSTPLQTMRQPRFGLEYFFILVMTSNCCCTFELGTL